MTKTSKTTSSPSTAGLIVPEKAKFSKYVFVQMNDVIAQEMPSVLAALDVFAYLDELTGRGYEVKLTMKYEDIMGSVEPIYMASAMSIFNEDKAQLGLMTSGTGGDIREAVALLECKLRSVGYDLATMAARSKANKWR